MSLNPQVGDTVSFDRFPYLSERDRVIMPLHNPSSTMLTGPWQVYFDPVRNAPRIVDDTIIMATFERTPEGWKRIK